MEALDIKTPSLDQLVLNLSGGNQQKVALAKCLALDPEIFIFMEPTQGIDVGVKFDIYQFIAAQAAAGRAVLLISSELAGDSGAGAPDSGDARGADRRRSRRAHGDAGGDSALCVGRDSGNDISTHVGARHVSSYCEFTTDTEERSE